MRTFIKDSNKNITASDNEIFYGKLMFDKFYDVKPSHNLVLVTYDVAQKVRISRMHKNGSSNNSIGNTKLEFMRFVAPQTFEILIKFN